MSDEFKKQTDDTPVSDFEKEPSNTPLTSKEQISIKTTLKFRSYEG